jgi:hypothetical protein
LIRRPAPLVPPGGLDAARAGYQGWPVLSVLLDNAEMSLAKTDRRMAARHLALGGRDDLTAQVLAEYDLTRRLLLKVTGHARLLAGRPVLSRAVALRDPMWTRCLPACGRWPNCGPGRAPGGRRRGSAIRWSGCYCWPPAGSRPACRTPAERAPR